MENQNSQGSRDFNSAQHRKNDPYQHNCFKVFFREMFAKGSIKGVILKAQFLPKVQLFCRQSVLHSHVTQGSLLKPALLDVVVVLT